MKRFQLIIICLAALCVGVTASAQQISLRSLSGGVTVSGTLLDYDGESYQLNTVFGDMTVHGAGVTCTGHACPNPAEYATSVTLNVSRSIGQNLLPALIEDFAFQNGQTVKKQGDADDIWQFHIGNASGHSMATVQMALTDTGDGFKNLIDLKADINASFRPAKNTELMMAQDAGVGNLSGNDHRMILALDGLVLVTSPQNPVQALSLQEISDVYAGTITNWSVLGGIDAPINLYRLGNNADLTSMFHDRIWAGDAASEFTESALVLDHAVMSEIVEADPFAIGFTNFAGIGNAKPLALRGSCNRVIEPTQFSLKTEDYPLTQHLYLYKTKFRLSGYMNNFMAYLDRTPAQRTIESLGYVSRDIAKLPMADQGTRLTDAILDSADAESFDVLLQMTKLLGSSDRLSTTFRFNESSVNLDERSLNNAVLLAHLVEQGDFDGRTLVVAGFSDSQGSAAGNRQISALRAKKVVSAIRAAATKADLTRVTFKPVGYGATAPIGCNDTVWGRQVNRRVEVWLQ